MGLGVGFGVGLGVGLGVGFGFAGGQTVALTREKKRMFTKRKKAKDDCILEAMAVHLVFKCFAKPRMWIYVEDEEKSLNLYRRRRERGGHEYRKLFLERERGKPGVHMCVRGVCSWHDGRE